MSNVIVALEGFPGLVKSEQRKTLDSIGTCLSSVKPRNDLNSSGSSKLERLFRWKDIQKVSIFRFLAFDTEICAIPGPLSHYHAITANLFRLLQDLFWASQ